MFSIISIILKKISHEKAEVMKYKIFKLNIK